MSDPPNDPFKRPPLPTPTKNDIATLDLIVKRVREAAKTRHDFQNAASLAAGGKRLHPPVWESDLAKGGSTAPFLDLLARYHKDLEANAISLVNTIENAPLRDLLAERLGRLFPDIGFTPKRVLRVIGPGPSTVLDKIPPHGTTQLILLLQRTIKAIPESRSDPSNTYYW